MDTTGKRLGRLALALIGGVVGLVVGWVLFVDFGGTTGRILGVLLALAVGILGLRAAGNLAENVLAPYNVAEVSVEGPITRDGGSPLPTQPGGVPADAVVEQIEQADEDRNADALVVRLNTPGGEVVPSEDIRDAAAAFDGPTVAYATDTCASGGYWIASGCDHVVSREGSIVGSIGVIMSNVNAKELADKVGLEYERIAAGDYKDAGMPLKEFTEDEREYLQGIADEYYEQFVERVTAGRDLDPETVRETEARVFLGPEAKDRGLVDELGDEETVEDYLETELGRPVETREFVPPTSPVERLRGGAASVAYAFGAGVASVLGSDGASGFRLR